MIRPYWSLFGSLFWNWRKWLTMPAMTWRYESLLIPVGVRSEKEEDLWRGRVRQRYQLNGDFSNKVTAVLTLCARSPCLSLLHHRKQGEWVEMSSGRCSQTNAKKEHQKSRLHSAPADVWSSCSLMVSGMGWFCSVIDFVCCDCCHYTRLYGVRCCCGVWLAGARN